MRNLRKAILLVTAMVLMGNYTLMAQEAKEVLIKNINIFNGTSEQLITGKDVVLLGNKIKAIIPAGGNEKGYEEVIDGKGGYLTPGLIDAHWHTMLALPYGVVFSSPTQYLDAVATYEAKHK